jgi:hypothetical protein
VLTHDSKLHHGTFPNDTLQNGTVQNGAVIKWYIVIKWYMLLNSKLRTVKSQFGTLKNGTQTL